MRGSDYFDEVLQNVKEVVSALPKSAFNDFRLQWDNFGTPYQIGDFPQEVRKGKSQPIWIGGPNADKQAQEYFEKLYDDKGKEVGFRKFFTNCTTNKLGKEMVSSSFPPSDILISETGDYCINIAVAGYPKEDIKVSVDSEDDNYLVVSLGKEEKSEKEEKKDKETVKEIKQIYIQRGIKIKPTKIKFFVDPKKFNIEDIKGDIINGILYLVIGKNKNVKKVNLTF